MFAVFLYIFIENFAVFFVGALGDMEFVLDRVNILIRLISHRLKIEHIFMGERCHFFLIN